MAEVAATAEEAPETTTVAETENPSAQDMDLEAPNTAAEETPADGEANSKRAREEGEEEEEESGGEKKQKVGEEAPETITVAETENPSAQDMDLEAPDTAAEETPADGEANSKCAREEGKDEEEEEEGGGEKKQKVGDKSAEEERLEKLGEEEDGAEEEKEESVPVCLGPKSFGSSVEMFDYFYKFLHYWPPNLNANKYEHMVLLELLKKGHLEPEKKIGKGVLAFQVRYHPQWKSRCFFIIRNDESVDDFSFRKCVDHILPLPENMQIKADVNKSLGGGGRGHGGRGRGRGGGHGRGGRGRGGRSRN